MLDLRPPTATQLLAAWEHGLADPSARASALLDAVGAAPANLADDLPLGTRNRRLLYARALLFGAAAEMVADCATCGERLEVNLPVTGLVSAQEPDAAEPVIELHHEGYQLAIRLPTAADLLGLPDEVELATQELLARCIITAELNSTAPGRRVSTSPAGLPPDLVATVESALAEADPDAVVAVQLICPTCGDARAMPVDPVAFLWAEVDAWAWQLLSDVHTLAAAYGWGEEQILAMSPARRQAYLHLSGARSGAT